MAKKQKKNFKRRRTEFDNRPKFCKFTSLGIKEVDFISNKIKKYFSWGNLRSKFFKSGNFRNFRSKKSKFFPKEIQ